MQLRTFIFVEDSDYEISRIYTSQQGSEEEKAENEKISRRGRHAIAMKNHANHYFKDGNSMLDLKLNYTEIHTTIRTSKL